MVRTLAIAATLSILSTTAIAAPRCPSQVRVNGQCVAAGTLRQLEAHYGARTVPGSYWYDARSGLFGPVGQPAQGIIAAGLPFAGKLRRDASGGTTGVFINGRELHQVEVMALSQLGRVIPGRYWMDAMTNVGVEGNPMPFANLAALMAPRGQTNGGNRGGDNYYGNTMTGTYANSQGGCSYVMTPSGTVTSGCD